MYMQHNVMPLSWRAYHNDFENTPLEVGPRGQGRAPLQERLDEIGRVLEVTALVIGAFPKGLAAGPRSRGRSACIAWRGAGLLFVN
jgi:hypothetical protein